MPVETYCAALRKWQRKLNRVTRLDKDPLDEPVDLEDIRAAARELQLQPDANWN